MKLNKIVIKRRSLSEIINLLSAIYIFALTLIPLFRNRLNEGIFRYIFVMVILLWFVTSLLCKRKWINCLIYPTVLGFFTLLIMLIYVRFNYGDITLSRIVGPAFIFLFSYMGYYYSNEYKESSIKILIFFITIFSSYTAFTTLSALIDDPSVSRLMTSSSTSPEILARLNDLNVAGYDFIYGIVILLPILFKYTSSIKQSKVFKTLGYSILILLLILIGFSNFTTAYLLTITAIILNQTNTDSPKSKILLIFIPISLLLIDFLKDIIIWILLLLRDLSPGLRTKANLLGIIGIISGTNSLQEVTTRGTLLTNSFNSFKKNPFLGIGGYYTDNNIIGMHSQIVDDLARYGLIGYTPFLLYIVLVMKKIYSGICTIKIRKSFINSSILYLLLNFLNPTYSYNISFSYFLILPILSSYLDVSSSI